MLFLLLSGSARAELGFVQDVLFYSSSMSGGVLFIEDSNHFGEAVAVLPDLDGDGINEIAVGAPGYDADPHNFVFDNGAIWILFPRPNGALKDAVFISEGFAGYSLTLQVFQRFGSALESLGDIDGDGLPDLAVGGPGQNAANTSEGFVDILSLNPNGTVANARRLDCSDPALSGTFAGGDRFGHAVAVIGDVDGDGVDDMAVGGPNRSAVILDGRVWILFMNADGSVRGTHVIDAAELSANGTDSFVDTFIGDALAPLGDLDGDGLLELAISDPALVHNTAGAAGAVYVVSLAADGSVTKLVTVTNGLGGFGGDVENFDYFGADLANVGDLDGDGRDELAVGATQDGDGGFRTGAIWILFFNQRCEVSSWEKISVLEGGLGKVTDPNGEFGRGLTLYPDQNNNGLPSLLVGASRANAGGPGRGALYRLEVGPTDPAAVFSTLGTTTGTAPLTVDFVDGSLGAGVSAWAWDFGDGSSSSDQNPSHTYTDVGPKDVSLTVTGSQGQSSVTKVAYICLDTSARAVVRNGAGVNPLVFTPVNTPVLGTTWSADVDSAAAGASGAVVLFLAEEPLSGVFLSYGELLVDPTSPLLLTLSGFDFGSGVVFSTAVPSDSNLLGFSASSQVYFFSTKSITNAIDLVLGD